MTISTHPEPDVDRAARAVSEPGEAPTVCILGGAPQVRNLGVSALGVSAMKGVLQAFPRAGLILGGIWGIWHLPAFYLSGTPQSTWSFFPFFIASVAVCVIVTPLFNASGDSILLPALHLRVTDSLLGGVGAGNVSLMSAIKVGSDAGNPELNSGALYRYLAESVWHPTTLLPQSGVK